MNYSLIKHYMRLPSSLPLTARTELKQLTSFKKCDFENCKSEIAYLALAREREECKGEGVSVGGEPKYSAAFA